MQSSTQCPLHDGPFRLSDLPAEVRNRVYSFALRWTPQDYVDHHLRKVEHWRENPEDRDVIASMILKDFRKEHVDWIVIPRHGVLSGTAKALSQVSRSVRSEATDVYFFMYNFMCLLEATPCGIPYSCEAIDHAVYDTCDVESWIKAWGTLTAPHVRRLTLGAHSKLSVTLKFADTTRPVIQELPKDTYCTRENLDYYDGQGQLILSRTEEDSTPVLREVTVKRPDSRLSVSPVGLIAIVRALFHHDWTHVADGFAAKSVQQQEQEVLSLLEAAATQPTTDVHLAEGASR